MSMWSLARDIGMSLEEVTGLCAQDTSNYEKKMARQCLVLMNLSLRLSASQRRPLPARILPCDSNFPSTAALETLMRFISLEATDGLLPTMLGPRC